MDVRANRVTSDSASKGTILVLGGDGFCGWPTSLHLSAVGYDVAIVEHAGHFLQLDQPERVAELVLSFIGSTD